jgi:hypothetical protein
MRSEGVVRPFMAIVSMVMIMSMPMPMIHTASSMNPELPLRCFPEGVLDRFGPPYPRDSGSIAFLIKLLRQFLAQLDIDFHRVRLLALGYHGGNTRPTPPLRPSPPPTCNFEAVVPVPQNRPVGMASSIRDGFVVYGTSLM